MAAKVGQVVIDLLLNTAKFETDVKKAARSLKSVGKEMQTAGKALSVSVTAPILAAGAAFVKAASDIKEGMKTIRMETGETGKALEELGGAMRSVLSKVPASVNEVATAISGLHARLGMTGKPLEDLATQMLNLSRMTKVDVNEVVRDATRVFGQWSVATGKQGDVLDYLFKASQKSGIQFSVLMQGIVQYGAQLKSFGFDLEHSAALLALWEKGGINAEKALAGLSMGLGKFAKAGIDPAAGLRTLSERMKAAGNETKAMQLAIQSFGTRSGAVLGRAMIEGRLNIEEFITAVQGSKDTINKAAEDTLGFSKKLEILKNRAMLAAEPIGVALLKSMTSVIPYFESFLRLVSQVADAFSKLSPSVQASVITIAGLAAAIGPAVYVIGSMIRNIGMLLGTFGLMPLAIGAVIIAVVAYRDEIANAIAKTLEWLGIVKTFNTQWRETVNAMSPEAFMRVAAEIGIFSKDLRSLLEVNKDAIRILGQHKDQIAKLKEEYGAGKLTYEQYLAAVRTIIEPQKEQTAAIGGTTAAFADLDSILNKATKKQKTWGEMIADQNKDLEERNRLLGVGIGMPGLGADWVLATQSVEDLKYLLEQVHPRLQQNDEDWKQILKDMGVVPATTEETRKMLSQYPEIYREAGKKSKDAWMQQVSTIWTDLSRNLARNIVEWKGWKDTVVGTIKSFAEAALRSLIEGFLSPLRNAMYSLGRSIIGFFTGGKFSFGGAGGGGGFLGSIFGGGGGLLGGILGGGAGSTALAGTVGATAGAIPGIAYGSVGSVAAGAGAGAGAGGGLFGALGGMGKAIAAFATNPITMAVAAAAAAAVGIYELVKALKGKNAYQAGAPEVMRDFGVSVSENAIKTFFDQLGISESGAYPHRKPLLSSPTFMASLLQAGMKPDLSKMANLGAYGKGYDFSSAMTKAMAGNWTDYNKLFSQIFGPELSQFLPGWQKQLLIPGFQRGIDYVPQNTLAYLHRGERVTPASQNGPSSVVVRMGDINIHISSRSEDLVRVVKQEVIPILKREMGGGNTGLREAVRLAYDRTAGAY